MTSADVKFSIDEDTKTRRRRLGLHQHRHQHGHGQRRHTVVDQAQVPVGAAAGRPVAVLQRHHPEELRRQELRGVLQGAGRHRPLQVGRVEEGPVRQARREPRLLGRGSRTWTASPGPSCPTPTPASSSCRAARSTSTSTPDWSSFASLKTTPGITAKAFPSTRMDYMAFNEQRKPFQDVHVRRAIAYAIDREAMVKAVLFGNGTPANSLLSPGDAVLRQETPAPRRSTWPRPSRRWPSPRVPNGFSTTHPDQLRVTPTRLSVAQIMQSELKPSSAST